MDTFSQKSVTPNTQGENKNTILRSEKRNNSDELAETLKWSTIINIRYYESYSANVNDANIDPASDLKVAPHTSDGKKRKVTKTRNGYLSLFYGVTGPSQSSPHQLTLGLTIGLQLMERLSSSLQHLRQHK